MCCLRGQEKKAGGRHLQRVTCNACPQVPHSVPCLGLGSQIQGGIGHCPTSKQAITRQSKIYQARDMNSELSGEGAVES